MTAREELLDDLVAEQFRAIPPHRVLGIQLPVEQGPDSPARIDARIAAMVAEMDGVDPKAGTRSRRRLVEVDAEAPPVPPGPEDDYAARLLAGVTRAPKEPRP